MIDYDDPLRVARGLEDALTRSEASRWRSADSIEASVATLFFGQVQFVVWDQDNGMVLFSDPAGFHVGGDEVKRFRGLIRRGGLMSDYPIVGPAATSEHALHRLQMSSIGGGVVSDAGVSVGYVSFATHGPYRQGSKAVTTYYRPLPDAVVSECSDRVRRFLLPPRRNGGSNDLMVRVDALQAALVACRDVIDAALYDLDGIGE